METFAKREKSKPPSLKGRQKRRTKKLKASNIRKAETGLHWIRMCFLSSVPTTRRKFHCSLKSFAMASHSSADEDGCNYVFQRRLYIASHVSDIIFGSSYSRMDQIKFVEDSLLKIWGDTRIDKDFCDSAIARIRRVIHSLFPGDIDFQKFVSCIEINCSTR